MRGLVVLASVMLSLVTSQSPAGAHQLRHRGFYHQGHHYGRYLAVRHRHHVHRYASRRVKHVGRRVAGARVVLPAPCKVAASMGGPCGCWTEYSTRGFLDHVREGVNWWLAGDWLGLRRSIPVLGTAAVWKDRSHVAPVLRDNKDGTVTVRDYWGVRKVSLKTVVIVDPHPLIRVGWVAKESWPL